METKVGMRIQSAYSKFGGDSAALNNYMTNAVNETQKYTPKADIFKLSLTGSDINSAMDVYRKTAELRKGIADGTIRRLDMQRIAADDFEKRSELSFNLLNGSTHATGRWISRMLKDAGVPEDVAFEFDYNRDTREFVLTEISDERYREDVQSVLAVVARGDGGDSLGLIAYGSRVLNGFTSSVYYSSIGKHLKSCFGQDISELYIDENGNIGGANKNLQEALAAEKNTKNFDAQELYDFPVNQIEKMLKRLITDENITPNISHMVYDGEGFYTNDGDIHLGKEIDPALFEDRGFLAKASFALLIVIKGDYDYWLNNEDLFC
ncbi:MAG: hypothetical protein J1E40_02865 [Oscillospiraceae bacterium]|nr:hypothetical protein [Oscillospiraceae bacterium]